jgi:hypothetical protein
MFIRNVGLLSPDCTVSWRRRNNSSSYSFFSFWSQPLHAFSSRPFQRARLNVWNCRYALTGTDFHDISAFLFGRTRPRVFSFLYTLRSWLFMTREYAKAVVFNLGYAKTSYMNKTKHNNRLKLEPALILALTKIRPRIEVLTCQKQAQSSH